MAVNSDTHEFALYWPELSTIFATVELGSVVTISRDELIHRIATVLRMKANETVCLFDQTHHIKGKMGSIAKNKVTVEVVAKQANIQLQPRIEVILPILQREAMSQAIYSCVELGAQEIWLVMTEKSQRLRNQEIDMQRFGNIAIAAAEQSKHFAFPDIQVPRTLDELLPMLDYQNSVALFCDPIGKKMGSAMEQLRSGFNSIMVMIGPEGDLTKKEKEFVKQYPFTFTSLTPTILRAQQALTVGLGIIRSI